MALLTFRAATNNADTSFSTNTIAATQPTGTVAGDLQILWATCSALAPAAAPTFSTPAGWTQRGVSSQFSLASGVLNIRVYLFTRHASGPGGTVTLTASANGAFGVVRESYQNPDSAAPFGQVVFGSGGPDTAPVLSSLTTTKINALLGAFISQGVAQNCAPGSSGMTERVDNATTGISAYDVIQSSIGASGTKTLSLPGSADYVWGFAEFWSELPASRTITPTGGVSLAGVADLISGRVFVPSGGVVLSGTAPMTFSNGAVSYTIVPSGGVTLAGAGEVSFGKVFQPSGGVSLSGTVQPLHGKQFNPSGGFSLTGTNSFIRENTIVPTGGIVFSGTAPLIFNGNVPVGVSTRLPLTFAGQ